MIKDVLIPEDRLKVFLSVRKKLSGMFSVDIKAEGNLISLEGGTLDIMEAETVVKAIGRGFSPVKAFMLEDEENVLIVMKLPKERKRLIKVKSRLIGTNGKCRRNLERLTGTCLSVYGKTASIIGRYDSAEKCRQAAEMLIKGSPHKNVYKFLEGAAGEE